MLKGLAREIMAAKRAALWRGIGRVAAVMTLAILAGMAALGGLAFAGVGLYQTLAQTMSPWQAGAIVGGAALLAALVLVLITMLLTPRRTVPDARHATPHETPGTAQAARPATEDHAEQLGQTIGEVIAKSNIRTTDVVLGALVAGVVMGASPRLRRRRPRHNRSGRSTDR